MRITLLVVVAALAAFTLTACNALPEITAFRDQAATARADLSAEIDRLESAAEAAPASDPARAALAEARHRHNALDSAIADLDQLIAHAQGTENEGVLERFSGLTPLIPEPFRLPAVLAAGLGLSLVRARQLKRSAASIARGLGEAMDRDPQLKHAIEPHADLFRATQTKTARRIVDETTKPDRPMLRLPI